MKFPLILKIFNIPGLYMVSPIFLSKDIFLSFFLKYNALVEKLLLRLKNYIPLSFSPLGSKNTGFTTFAEITSLFKRGKNNSSPYME